MSDRPSHLGRLVRSRGLRLAMLVFELVWLNVIVPGHRRGIVSLPGQSCPACEGRSCQLPAGNSDSHHRTPGDPAAHCAICFFAARLSPAVAFDFTHPPLRLLTTVLPPLVSGIDPLHVAPTYDGRAPPVG